MQYSSGLQRYFNEHIHLPNTFFDNPMRFVKHALMEKGDLMAKAYNFVELGYEDLEDVIPSHYCAASEGALYHAASESALHGSDQSEGESDPDWAATGSLHCDPQV